MIRAAERDLQSKKPPCNHTRDALSFYHRSILPHLNRASRTNRAIHLGRRLIVLWVYLSCSPGRGEQTACLGCLEVRHNDKKPDACDLIILLAEVLGRGRPVVSHLPELWSLRELRVSKGLESFSTFVNMDTKRFSERRTLRRIFQETTRIMSPASNWNVDKLTVLKRETIWRKFHIVSKNQSDSYHHGGAIVEHVHFRSIAGPRCSRKFDSHTWLSPAE